MTETPVNKPDRLVQATRDGFMSGTLMRGPNNDQPGTIFTLPPEASFAPSWMKEVTDHTAVDAMTEKIYASRETRRQAGQAVSSRDHLEGKTVKQRGVDPPVNDNPLGA
jgi:hypothetical protein